MTENWKKFLTDEEQKRKNEIKNQNEENENTKNKIGELKKSLPEIKKKIIELNNFFSNYTIEIEKPVIDGREDTYAQIKWVLKFYQGKKDLFSTVHFKKDIEGFSFIQNPKIQDSKTYDENKDAFIPPKNELKLIARSLAPAARALTGMDGYGNPVDR